VASRKEEKERLRAAREAAEEQDRSKERKQLVLGYAVAGVITLAVVVGIVIAVTSGGGSGGGETVPETTHVDRVNEAYAGIVPEGITVDDRDAAEAPTEGNTADLQAAAAAANCELILEQEEEGSNHLEPGAPIPDYEANPPTSGDHSLDVLADGAFRETPSPLNYVHALEHGRVEIQYHSDLPEEQQTELLGLFDQAPAGMILFPNDDQPYTVAATAWTQTMGCEDYKGAKTLDAIRAFRSAYLARGPEAIGMG